LDFEEFKDLYYSNINVVDYNLYDVSIIASSVFFFGECKVDVVLEKQDESRKVSIICYKGDCHMP
jgi:hypothetical protein